METFFKLTRDATRAGEHALELIEVQANGAVTRLVFEDLDGELLSNSISIMAHRNGAFSEYARGNAAASLWTKRPPSTDDAADWASFNCTAESISRAEFEKQFRRARPDINTKS